MIITNTDILGIQVSTLNQKQTAKAINHLINRYTKESNAQYVATLNMDFLANCFSTISLKVKNQELYTTLQTADLVTADGMPIVCFGKMSNTTMKHRVTGADIVYDIADYAALLGHKIFYIGENVSLCKKAHNKLKEKYPRLKAAGYASPMISKEGEILDDKDLINKINDSEAKILFLGLGNPKQEMFFRRHKKDLKVAVSIGIGGSYNFITGEVKRAPKVLQDLGLEWAYRLSREPYKLWKRYFRQIMLLISLLLHGRLKIMNYISYNLLHLKEHYEVLDGSVRVVGRLNDAMVEKIYYLINECAFSKLDIRAVTVAEGKSMYKLKKLCNITGVNLLQINDVTEKQKTTQWLRRKTVSLITRVM